jgi:hypothetical protein
VLFVAGGIWLVAGDASRAQAEEPKDGKVKELLKERLAVLPCDAYRSFTFQPMLDGLGSMK